MRRGGFYPWVGSRVGRRGFAGVSVGSGPAASLLGVAAFVVLCILALPIETSQSGHGGEAITAVAGIAVAVIVVVWVWRRIW